MTMRMNNIKAILKAATLAAAALLLTASASFAQQVVNMTAAPTTTTLPDGTTVPMWGYFCGTAAANVAPVATCAALNPASVSTVVTVPSTWSPIVITVPTGQALTINLTNSLSVTTGTVTNSVPTSLTIVGQLGGGLGTITPTSAPGNFTAPPDHSLAQQVTWPIASPGAANAPPAQGPRVQSFGTQVAAGATTALIFGTATNPLRPGTYLIESGTHPSIQGPMGLYGILVVTTAPAGATAGRAYPAVGTTAAVTYNAEIPLLLSEIDPVQNNAVAKAVTLTGFSETTVWSGQPGGCGNPATLNSGNCYPPAVNYTPLYYLFNGVAFNKTSASTSLFAASPAAGVTGNVLVRFVNAGLRMHVPSIVGSQTGVAVAPATVPPAGFSLIAEDGNPLPGVPRVQSEVFLPAGKTYDVMINAPATVTTALPVFDRQLSLSGNGTARDAGMLAYIGINGSALPTAPAFASAVARADTYNSIVTGQTFTVSDPGKGVIANDTNVYGVKLVGTVAGLTLNTDGTFTYTGTPTSFTYCANGTITGTTCSSGITATVTLGAATIEAASGIIVGNKSYTSNTAAVLSLKPTGVLSTLWDACTPTVANPCHDRDAAGYRLTVALSAGNAPVASAGLTLTMDANGGFNASVPTCTTTTGCTYNFTYHAQNSQGTVSGPATVTLHFLQASNLSVKVLDGKDKTTVITDYRWIIEEDRTFYVNPNCTTNSSVAIAGCPPPTTGPNGTSVPLTFGTNFHTSYMPVVVTGCIGPTGAALACEAGQTVYDGGTLCTAPGVPAGCSATAGQHVPAVCDIGNGVCRPGLQEAAVNPSQVHLDPTKHYYLSVLPGDAGNPFGNANGSADCINGVSKATNPAACGHGMGGTPVVPTCTGTVCVFNPVTVYVQPDPYPPSKLSVFVFQDDF